MPKIDYLTEDDVKMCLDWDILIPAMEQALSQLSTNEVVQPPRLLMNIAEKNGCLLAMPCFSKPMNKISCKIVTSFPNNLNIGMDSILATIMLFDGDTGTPKVILEGNSITGWRTAGASVAATKHIHTGNKIKLAILGAGTQAKTHALAMQNQFAFQEVQIWNRNKEKAVRLCQELGPEFIAVDTAEECVREADIICTTTYAKTPILKKIWLKDQVHINAVGAGLNHHSELDEETYRNATIVVDHMDTAKNELKGLLDDGVSIWGEVGEIISGHREIAKQPITIFHSLGMAIEDLLAANLVYNTFQLKQRK